MKKIFLPFVCVLTFSLSSSAQNLYPQLEQIFDKSETPFPLEQVVTDLSKKVDEGNRPFAGCAAADNRGREWPLKNKYSVLFSKVKVRLQEDQGPLDPAVWNNFILLRQSSYFRGFADKYEWDPVEIKEGALEIRDSSYLLEPSSECNDGTTEGEFFSRIQQRISEDGRSVETSFFCRNKVIIGQSLARKSGDYFVEKYQSAGRDLQTIYTYCWK